MESVSISPPAPISPPSPIASTSTLPTIIDPPLTKTAAKRLAKKLAHDAGKQERRTKERNRKKEKNLEKRKLIDAGLLEREDPKKSKKAMRDGVKERFGSRVVIDLGFDDKMTDRVSNSFDLI